MNETLEAMARAIFNAWFIDFEPVKAKAAGASGFPGMPEDAFGQFPDQLVESELGPIPAGWKVTEVHQLAILSRELVDPASHPDEIFEHFSIPAFDADSAPSLEAGAAIKSCKCQIPPKSVLVSKLNPRIARAWLPRDPSDGRRQIASTEFLVAVPRKGWSRWYLYCQFTENSFREEMRQKATGTSTSHQRLRPKDFQSIRVLAPPQVARDLFRRTVEPCF
jgi:type I restriction enzyme S subunit